LLAKCYVFAQLILMVLVWKIFLFIVMILFFFYLIIWWGIGIASESKLEVLKDGWFDYHNCFYYFLIFCLLFYFIIIATSHIRGNNSNSCVYMGNNCKPWTEISILTQTCVYLEVNTHTGTLYYFINDKHYKDRAVNVPKDVYFEVWYFIRYLFLFIYMKNLQFKTINCNYYLINLLYFF
jgi:hypothetical protein